MASGIDWFRWHHGSVTDPKFQLVARKAGTSLGNVIAVWAFILEAASANEDRGMTGEIDCEAIDCLLCVDEGTTDRIIDCMRLRGLIEGESVTSWNKRQPKRERTDDNSTERSKAFRAAQRQETPCNASDNHATPCNAMQRQETPRVEESRQKTLTDADASVVASKLPTCPQSEIIELFAEELPELPQPRVWDDTRQKHLRTRWRWVLADLKAKGKPCTDADALAFFRRMFAYIRKSDFLMGRSNDWSCPGLHWIVEASNFAKIIEGAYDNKEAA